MDKHRLVHQLCNALGARQRKHIHRDIHGRLQEDHPHGARAVQPESKIDHIRKDKDAAPLKECYEKDNDQTPAVSPKPGHRLLITVDECVDLLFPFIRRLPDPHPDKKSFEQEGQMQDHLREKHHAQDQHDEDHVEQKPQKIQREIPPQFRVERRIPEQKNAGAYKDQNKFIRHGHGHQDNCAVRTPVAVLIHIVKLDRLSAGGGRGNAGIEEPDERILDAADQGTCPAALLL